MDASKVVARREVAIPVVDLILIAKAYRLDTLKLSAGKTADWEVPELLKGVQMSVIGVLGFKMSNQ